MGTHNMISNVKKHYGLKSIPKNFPAHNENGTESALLKPQTGVERSFLKKENLLRKDSSESKKGLQVPASDAINKMEFQSMLQKHNIESFRVEKHNTYEMEHSLTTSEGFLLIEKKELELIRYDDEIHLTPKMQEIYKPGKMTIEENVEKAVKTVMTHTKKINDMSYQSVEV